VVQIRIMRVGMHERGVFVAVGVRLAAVITRVVRVLMVFIVTMDMAVDESLVAV